MRLPFQAPRLKVAALPASAQLGPKLESKITHGRVFHTCDLLGRKTASTETNKRNPSCNTVCQLTNRLRALPSAFHEG